MLEIQGTSSLQAQDDTEGLRAETNGLMEAAKALVVQDAEGYEKAGAFIKALKVKAREVEAARVARTKPLNDTLKLINEDYKGIKEQLEAVVRQAEIPMASYIREQDKIRREAEAKARKEREEAEEKARNLAADERAKAEEARKQAQESIDPFEAALAEADAEAATEAANTAVREAHAIAAAPLCPELPKVSAAGTKIMRPWKFHIVDPTLIPREYLAVDEVKIGAYVRAMKEAASIPGVETYQDITIGG
jgi:hypothetical protein